MLKMNGKEFEFDLFDLETAEKYENAFAKVTKKLDLIEESEKLSVSIKKQCDAIRECMDGVFGAGTGKEVCGIVKKSVVVKTH